MIFCQNFNLPHTYGHCLKKPICDMIIIKLFIWLTNLFQSNEITRFSSYYKFHKNYVHFSAQIYSNITSNAIKKKKNVIFLTFDFFVFWFIITCKKLWKSFLIMTWLKFKHGYPWKTIQCDNNLGPHCCVFSLCDQIKWTWS